VNDDGTLLFHFDYNKVTTDVGKETTLVIATDRLAVAATITIAGM